MKKKSIVLASICGILLVGCNSKEVGEANATVITVQQQTEQNKLEEVKELQARLEDIRTVENLGK